MITLQKDPDKDFVILNLTDTQLGTDEWEVGHINRNILVRTVTELVKRVKPDLITISGDLGWAGQLEAYEATADFLDSFGIPWAPVWGNHDNQDGPEFVERVVEVFSKCRYFTYEKGDSVLGSGNYVIGIAENEKIVEGLILMDSHDRIFSIDEAGNETAVYAKIIPEQIAWYKQQVYELFAKGCKDTTMLMHIPIYAYRQAFEEAFRKDIPRDSVTLETFANEDCWNEGYKDTVGVQLEGICSHPEEDGVFEIIAELDSTKNIIAGHDHINNWIINYKGIRLIYGLKTGPGCYWDPRLNGGTVILVNTDGVKAVCHEYVNVSDLI